MRELMRLERGGFASFYPRLGVTPLVTLVNFFWLDLSVIGEDLGPDDLRVQRRDTVDLVAAHNGQVGHVDALDSPLFDDGELLQHLHILRIDPCHLVEPPPVDLKDDLQVARQHPLEQATFQRSSASGKIVWLV